MTATAGLPPGSSGLPLVGEMLAFGSNPRRFVEERYRRHGPIFRSHLLGEPVVVMAGPKALRFVLVTHRDHFTAGDAWPPGLSRLMEGSLMMRDGEEHDCVRRLLAPAFFGPALGPYVATMEEATERYLERWRHQGELRWYDEFKRLSFEIASQLILGAQAGADLERLSHLFDVYCRGMVGLHPIITLPWRWTPFGRAVAAREELMRHVGRLVAERRRAPTADALGRMVASLDAHGAGLDELEVAKHALFLLFAGHESTASLMTSFCLELARHPEVLARAREEQAALGEGPLTLARIGEMRYLDQVYLEVERLYPPFTGAFRRAAREFEFDGFRVPAGFKVFYAVTGTHHAPELYPEPDRFDPDRFEGANVAELRRDCRLVGFGAGARTCLGIEFARLEAKVVASRLLRAYRWRLLPGQSLAVRYLPSIHPKDGLEVAFEPLERPACAA